MCVLTLRISTGQQSATNEILNGGRSPHVSGAATCLVNCTLSSALLHLYGLAAT